MPSKKTRARISLADLVGFSNEHNPFTAQGLPDGAWKGFCVVAWTRLEQSNPRWGDLIWEEFQSFQATWLSKAHMKRYRGNVDDNWMRDAFQFMLQAKLKQGPKSRAIDSRLLLEDYNALKRAIFTIKKDNPGISKKTEREQAAFWQEKLQGILNHLPYHDETRTHATVTPAMVGKACFQSSPSEVALEILHHLSGAGPIWLKKKVFPKLRKPLLSPLELWREKLSKSPRT